MGMQTNAALPDGTLVGEYRILRAIASGGFSIVYLARGADDRFYAIKEYLPATLVRREAGALSPTIPGSRLGTYRQGLKAFFEEGRALARIVHPNVVRVVNFFRANETVYMVMAYERGHTLQQVILRHRGRPGRAVLAERHIQRLIDPVMQGLREVHANRLLHLDLKPGNVYLRFDGTPLLLDFGAARQTLGSEAPSLSPMFTPGFAAPELQRRTSPLGPWTDVYGIGATLYACMVAAPPQPADLRALDDRVGESLDRLSGVYSDGLLNVARHCLALDPMARPQSVFEVQRALRASVAQAGLPAAGQPAIGKWFDSIAGRLARRERGEGDPGRRASGA